VGWGWIVGFGAAWPGWDGWSFSKWTGNGYTKPVHCDGEDRATNTYTQGFCQFQVWDNLEMRAEFVDTVAPDTTLSGPSGLQRSTTASFTFTSNDHVPSTFKCSLDDGIWNPCTSPFTYFGLSQGSHALRVRAFDPSGNGDPSPALAQWTV